MTHAEHLRTIETISYLNRLWPIRSRPADRRELSLRLARAYSLLAAHYFDLSDEPYGPPEIKIDSDPPALWSGGDVL